jgi:hypothetical protein
MLKSRKAKSSTNKNRYNCDVNLIVTSQRILVRCLGCISKRCLLGSIAKIAQTLNARVFRQAGSKIKRTRSLYYGVICST